MDPNASVPKMSRVCSRAVPCIQVTSSPISTTPGVLPLFVVSTKSPIWSM